MGFDLELCNSMKERIISSLSGLIIEYGESLGFQVIVHLRITTTLGLGSAQSIDLMMNLLATNGAIIVNDDGSVGTVETMRTRTRTGRGVSKAVIDGLKKVTVFNGEGDDEKGIWEGNQAYFHAMFSSFSSSLHCALVGIT
ncbi:hypothetical protein ACSBR1_034895 [Camellia fascicularis]